MTGVESLLHVWSIAHGIGASLLCAACFLLAGSLLIPRRWDESLGSGESPAIAGAALYALACWFGVTLGVPVSRAAMGFVITVVVLSAFRGRWLRSALSARGVASQPARRWWLAYCGLYVLAYLFTMPPVTSADLPIAWTGNVDLLTYIRYTRYVWDLGPSNLVGFDYLNFVYLQTPAVFYLLGALSLPFGADPLSAAMPAQFAFTALIGLVAARISASVFKLSRPAAVAIGAVLISGPFFRYVAGAYFLSTLMATPALLYLLWVTVEHRPRRFLDAALAVRFAAAYVLLLLIYPFLLFAGVAAQVAAIALAAIADVQSGHGVRLAWREAVLGAARKTAVVLAACAALALCFYERLGWSLNMVHTLSEIGIAGWPLQLVSPLAMLALPGVRVDHAGCATCVGIEITSSAYRLPAIAAFSAIAGVLAWLYFRRFRRETTTPQRTFVGLAAGALVVYCAYYWRLGPSYQQWKFASYTVLPLSFVIYAGALHLIRQSRMSMRSTAAMAGVAVALVGGNLAIHASHDPDLMRFPGALRNIERVNERPPFSEMTLKMDEEPAAFLTWLALYFLPSKRVHVVSEIFSPNEPLDLGQIAPARPLLIQGYSCDGIGHDETMTVGGVGCLVSAPPSLVTETPYPFNRSFMFIEFDAMTTREAGGRWNTRPTLALKLTADPRRVSLGRDLYVNLLIQPFLPAGTKPQRLLFSWGSDRHGETLVADRDWVSLPISTTDWEGEWLSTLPVSIGFPDGRTLLFQELSVTAAPAGPIVLAAARVTN